MRAVVYRDPDGPSVREVADPTPGPGDVVVDVEACGLCGTDLRILRGEHRAYGTGVERVPGHEIVGRIAAVGGDDLPGELAVGDRVFVAPNVGCGWCSACARGADNLCPRTDGIGITLDGGFAHRVLVPARAVARGNLVALPESVDAATGVLVEPLACVLRGQDRVAVGAGDRVFVGGGGAVGLLHVALARARGAATIICSDPWQLRRDAARAAGADLAVAPEEVPEAVAAATGGDGVDVVVTAAPSPGLQAQAIELAAVAGRVLLFGGLPRSRPTVELDTNAIHYRELVLTGTTASSTDDCRRAVELLASGVVGVDGIVTDRVALASFDDAVAAATNHGALKVVVTSDRDH